MSERIFLCTCQKCGAEFEFTGSYSDFNGFMGAKNFTCPSGHKEMRSPSGFVKVVRMSEPEAVPEWKPSEGRNYVDILDYLTARTKGLQMDHVGSGLYIDRRTQKKYDYEEDAKGTRHYFEVPAMALASNAPARSRLRLTH
jgi:hypothetical protein